MNFRDLEYFRQMQIEKAKKEYWNNTLKEITEILENLENNDLPLKQSKESNND